MATSNHWVRLVSLDGEWQAKCTCRARSPYGGKADAGMWEYQHIRDVQRARAALARHPSLRAERDYYREQAENLSTSKAERDLWQRLADELDLRLTAPTDEDQLELW